MEVLAFTVVGLMAAAAILWRIPANECDQCDHCLAQRRTAEHRRQDELHRQWHSWYGQERCPICRRET
jgi:hypothetical protein